MGHVLASTARSESFATHLLIPILVVVALAQATRCSGGSTASASARGARARGRAAADRLGAARSAKQRIHAAHLVLSSLTPALGPAEAVGCARAGGARRLHLRPRGEPDGAAHDARRAAARRGDRRRAGELSARAESRSVRGKAPALPTFAAVHAYRVACEAISNSRATRTCTIDVTLERARRRAAAGGPRRRPRDRRAGAESTGLESMRARAEPLGGRLQISGGARRHARRAGGAAARLRRRGAVRVGHGGAVCPADPREHPLDPLAQLGLPIPLAAAVSPAACRAAASRRCRRRRDRARRRGCCSRRGASPRPALARHHAAQRLVQRLGERALRQQRVGLGEQRRDDEPASA